MYQIPDWRTDNWAGNKPTWWRDGKDLKFPRTMREAGFIDDFNRDEVVEDNFSYTWPMFMLGLLAGCYLMSDASSHFHEFIEWYTQCIALIKG